MSKLYLKAKNNFRKRKGLINVIKTYKTRGFMEAFVELIFLVMERLKVNPGKFIISRQAIYLYEGSKHLTSLEKILMYRKKNNHHNLKKTKFTNKIFLQSEEI